VIPDRLIKVAEWKELKCQSCLLGLSCWITKDQVIAFIFCSVCLQKVRRSGSDIGYITEDRMEEIEKSRKEKEPCS